MRPRHRVNGSFTPPLNGTKSPAFHSGRSSSAGDLTDLLFNLDVSSFAVARGNRMDDSSTHIAITPCLKVTARAKAQSNTTPDHI